MSSPAKPGIQPVASWSEVREWCRHPITQWTLFEGRNRLFTHLATNHYGRFIQWNDVARLNLAEVEPIVESLVRPALAMMDDQQSILETVMGHLTGALMETEYWDCAPEFQLFQSLIDYYAEGRFPCGWICGSEEEFPDERVLLLF
jgi:hypothetical protein